mgnify:FL=1
MFSKKTSERIVEIILIIIYCIGVILLLPISSAIFLAYLIFPIIHFINKITKIPYAICLLLVASFLTYLVYQLILFISQTILSLLPLLFDFIHTIQNTYPIVNVIFSELIHSLQNNSSQLFQSIQTSFSTLMNLLLFLFSFIFSIFECKKDRLWFFDIVPKKFRKRWKRNFIQFASLMRYFFWIEFVLFSVTFMLLTLVFYIFKFPYYLNLAFIVAIVDLLPMLGLGLFFIPLCIYYLVAKNVVMAVAFIVIYLSLIAIRQLIESVLWANSLQVHTAHSFFIMAASVLLFGFYGLFISPIVIILLLKLKKTSYF